MVAAQTSMDWLSALGLTWAGRPDGADRNGYAGL
jgi:hypothetical protein